MSKQNDPWEDVVGESLESRVRDLHAAPLTLDAVKGSARAIRRRRRAVAAGSVLAAAAVVLPVAVLGVGGLGDDAPDQPAASDPATPTDGGSTGADTRTRAYLQGTTLHRYDGSTVSLAERYDSVVDLGTGVLVTSRDEQGNLLLATLVDGEVESEERVLDVPVVNGSATAVVVDADRTLQVSGTVVSTPLSESEPAAPEQRRPVRLDRNDYVTALSPECQVDAATCPVYVQGAGGAAVVDAFNGERTPVPDAIEVVDVSRDGMAAVLTSYEGEQSCWAVRDAATGAEAWASCESSLFAFSPDGRHLSGTHPYQDGLGNAWLAIIDADTGRETARYTPPSGVVATSAWEDDEHLLAVTVSDDGWQLVRVGLDGEGEVLATDGASADAFPAPFVLEAAS
ncbi:hypothetical protein [Nocardioides nanhaiensis]|uniref:WD40 repeat domain-containing protein n=1 Tax=Nocardioides nanhaiensis TaxID=1476871 RepID=A0ABP8VXX6_9ACTN